MKDRKGTCEGSRRRLAAPGPFEGVRSRHHITSRFRLHPRARAGPIGRASSRRHADVHEPTRPLSDTPPLRADRIYGAIALIMTVLAAYFAVRGGASDGAAAPPSTLTVRAAAAAGLLLRNGTALIFSPNHKTAADAIGAAPQKPKKRRHGDGCDKSIQAVQ